MRDADAAVFLPLFRFLAVADAGTAIGAVAEALAADVDAAEFVALQLRLLPLVLVFLPCLGVCLMWRDRESRPWGGETAQKVTARGKNRQRSHCRGNAFCSHRVSPGCVAMLIKVLPPGKGGCRHGDRYSGRSRSTRHQ